MALRLRWEDPPEDARGRVTADECDDHEAIAAALKARPRRWARIPVSGTRTGVAANIQRGRIAAYRPAGAFEAKQRTVDGKLRVYARFVGEASS